MICKTWKTSFNRVIVMVSICAQYYLSPSAYSMTFSLIKNSGDSHKTALFAQGPIEDGDADKFRAIVSNASRDEFGSVILFLNSPGGSVNASFELVQAMDLTSVTTMVGGGSICASACASILFVSGQHRKVLEGGHLGFHSCYTKQGNNIVNPQDDVCNERIGENAVRHGVDYGDIVMWANGYGPQNMAWLDKEMACFELAICH